MNVVTLAFNYSKVKCVVFNITLITTQTSFYSTGVLYLKIRQKQWLIKQCLQKCSHIQPKYDSNNSIR